MKQRILGWLNSGSHLRQNQFKEVLLKFKVNKDKNSNVRRVLKVIMGTAAGGAWESFYKWKALPDLRDKENLVKGTKFEKKLMILLHKR